MLIQAEICIFLNIILYNMHPSRPFTIGVGRDHSVQLATILSHIFHLTNTDQCCHTCLLVKDTLDLVFFGYPQFRRGLLSAVRFN